MALDLRQNLKLSQQLLMTPQLRQAIKLLQLSRFELDAYLTQQLEENPVLELEGSASELVDSHGAANEGEAALENASEGESRRDEWTESDVIDQRYVSRQGEEQVNYEQFVSHSGTLAEHLLDQMYEVDFSEEENKQ